MGAEADVSPPPPEPTASPEPEILLRRNDDRDWKADMMAALGESVSFGRFLSEPLEWGKRSAFGQSSRYLDEAARQSRPGSVARKKAFFEEHYARKRKKTEAVEDDAGDADADADATFGGAACWSADSSCTTADEPAGEENQEMRAVDSSPDCGVAVDAAPVDAASQELKAVASGVALLCSLDNTGEDLPHKRDDVQPAEARNRLRLDDGGVVATADSIVEKLPLQESPVIVNQGITDSAKKRRLSIASLFQRPAKFSSPPSGKKTPSSSVKRQPTLRSAKENTSPSPSTGSNRHQGASVARNRSSTFGTLHMSMNFKRCETGSSPASNSRNLGSTVASRIRQLESASRPVKDSHPKANQFRQTRKGSFKEIASRTSQQHEKRSSHFSLTTVKEKLFGSTSSLVHPKANIAKENKVNANNEPGLKELSPSIRFKARPPRNFY